MNYTQNIVVISGKGKNPAKLQTQLEPVKLNKSIGIAITSISYGELYNIHSENNTIYVSKINTVPLGENNQSYNINETLELEIPIGTYKNVSSILKKIQSSIRTAIPKSPFSSKNQEPVITVNATKDKIISLTMEDILIHVEGKTDSPWNLLGIKEDITPSTSKTLQIENRELLIGMELAFLYVNIVENSYINGKKSRNLSLIPLSRQKGCSYHAFTNPIYIPVEVKQFSDIFLELRDMDGEYVKFNPDYNTVITLHLKSLNM